MSIDAFLVSMQAAGAISDIYSTSQQVKIGRAGTQIELAQLNTRLEEERTSAAMRSLDAMQQLRMTLASQRAIFAARGQAGGAGSALAISSKSVNAYEADERVRRMNLLTKQSILRAAGALTGMHQLSSETQLGQQLSQRLWDNAPFTELGEMFKKSTTKKSVEGV